MTADEALLWIRAASLALPNVIEKLSHGAPSWFIEKKGQFAMFVSDYHDDVRPSLWLAAPPGLQESLIQEDSDAFFRPPYFGPRGWLGVRLDADLPLTEVEDLIQLAHSTISSKKKR